MPVAYRSSYREFNLDPYSDTILNKPAGLANGDTLVMFVQIDDPSGHVDWPSGFTERLHYHGYHTAVAVATKYVSNAAGEPSTYAVDPSNTSAQLGAELAAYSGVDQSSPIVDVDAWANSSQWSTLGRLDDVTVTAGGLIVGWAAVAHADETVNWSTPSGYTARTSASSASGSRRQLLADKASAAAGFSGAVTGWGPSADGIEWVSSIHLCLRASNFAPFAPSLQYPVGGASVDRTATQRFDWTFSDPDPGDTQASYELRYRVLGSSTWTTVTGSTSTTHHDFSAFTFSANTYEWQARVTDNNGAVGPWTTSATFTATTPSADTPTIVEPVAGSSVGTTATVRWSVSSQTNYQVRTVNDVGGNPGSTVYTDTGEVAGASVRGVTVPFAVNGRTEHVQVRVRESGVLSGWASARVVVSHTPPATPTLAITAQAGLAALDVAVTNPPPTGQQPAVTHNEVWVDDGEGDGLVRLEAALPPNSTFRYWLPIGGRDYTTANVRVLAVGVNGLSTWSAE